MRWISRWIFVRNAVKCGEFFFHRIHRFHRISYINLPQKSMRWIFVRNAVNFAVKLCKNAVKCGEIFIFTAFTANTAFLTKIHRIQRISCENSPHSTHFLRKFTLKPRPGKWPPWMPWRHRSLFRAATSDWTSVI